MRWFGWPVLLFCLSAWADGGPFDYQAVPITDGVWLLQRPDPTRQPVEGNITVIAGDEALLVVDTGGTPLSGRNAVRLIRELSAQPVRYVVNTHWHGDHHLGNPAFRDAWPDAEFIAHANTARDMTGEAMNYLDGQDGQIRQGIDQLGGLLDADTDPRGEPLDEATRHRYQRLYADLQVMLVAFREIRTGGVDRTFEDRLVLDLGGLEAHVIHPGRGNTEGDAVVHLPARRLLITGDLVVAPTPYGFGSYPGEWIESLAALKALDWTVLIPGHGDPMRDAAYLDLLAGMIAEFRVNATIAVAQDQDLEVFRAGLDTSGWQARIAGDDALLKQLYQAWWVQPFSRSAWLEASGLPIVQGDDGL